MWESQEVPLSRKTAAGWLAGVAGLFDPLYRELKAHVFASKVLGTDDTSVKVLDRSLDYARTGRLWPHCGDGQHPGVVFNYTQTRGAADALEFLKEIRGYLQADAYSEYDQLFKQPSRGVIVTGRVFDHDRDRTLGAREKISAEGGGKRQRLRRARALAGEPTL